MIKNVNLKNNNIEILRIITMLMIIASHAIVHGEIYESLSVHSINYFLIKFFDIVFNVAVNVYVAISGYLLCEKEFKVNRVVGLWLQILFYATSIYLILILTNVIDFLPVEFIKVLLPISGNQYWFARVYIGLYLFMPFFNMLIKTLTKKQHQYLLVLCISLFSLWPSFIPFARTLNSEGGNSIIWFGVIYFFAAYIKKYGVRFCQFKYLIFGTAFLFCFSFVSSIAIGFISEAIGLGGRGMSIFTTLSSFPMLLGSIGILCIAVNIKQTKKFGKVIQAVSSSVFSVYLIHDNKYLRDIIWKALRISEVADKLYAIPYILGVSILIFIVCVLIDKVTYFQVNKILSRIKLEKISSKLNLYLYNRKFY